jgi:hypothetical protein
MTEATVTDSSSQGNAETDITKTNDDATHEEHIFEEDEPTTIDLENNLVTDEMNVLPEGITIVTGEGTVTDEETNRARFVSDIEPSFIKHNKVCTSLVLVLTIYRKILPHHNGATTRNKFLFFPTLVDPFFHDMETKTNSIR